MLSKDEQREKNKAFWGAFNDFMKKTRSSSGRRVNWVSYPTDVSCIFLRLHADAKGASIFFDIQPKDSGVREIIWEQLLELKVVLENSMSIPTHWIEDLQLSDGRTISRLSWQIDHLNYFKEADQVEIFTFFQTHLIEFDAFYQEFKEILINLVD